MTKTEEWRRRIEKWNASGLSVEAFAEREGLTVQALRWWRWKVGTPAPKIAVPSAPAAPKATSPAFAQIVLAKSAREHAGMFEVLAPSGHLVRFSPEFDDEALRRVLAVLSAVGGQR
jgi:hypothetical protein